MSALTPKQQYWTEQLDQFHRSGLSLTEFAKEQNIPVQKFYQWRNILKKKTTTRTESTEVQFTELISPDLRPPFLSLQHKETHISLSQLPEASWLACFVKELHRP